MSELSELKEFACLLAEESAKVIRPYFRALTNFDTKKDNSPVTIADRKGEEIMRELIMKQLPDHGIVGEEFGNYNESAEYRWVLDPIDGTISFVCGLPIFGTLIALVHGREPVLGIIHQPIIEELMLGDNEETILNGQPVRVRDCKDISSATLLTTDPYLIMQHKNFERFEALRKRVMVYRGAGDCYGYLLLAAGQVDIMLDPIMNAWDITALIPVVRGAGGQITDYHGADPMAGSSIVATSGKIHDQVIRTLNS
jgi:myo-inositol-1(or 4)-monophosphatase